MDRANQHEEELFQQGKRDGFNKLKEQITNEMYRAGWREGVMLRLKGKEYA